MPAPTGEERRKCHAARDSYFACLSLNGNSEEACSKEKELYNSLCPAAWVGTYFVICIDCRLATSYEPEKTADLWRPYHWLHLAGKPVVASPNVGCFLRPATSRPHEFLSERSELYKFRQRSGWASEEAARGIGRRTFLKVLLNWCISPGVFNR